MKTPINLADYQFSAKNNPLFQISDDPINKLVRVIEINRAEFAFDIDMIMIKATTYYIDPVLKIIVFTQPTTCEKKDWSIIKGENTIKIDENLQPIENPDFDEEQEVSPENYPYILTDSYLQFKEIMVNLNEPILNFFISSNDSKNLFD